MPLGPPTFCGVCRHPSDIPPGHEEGCPVYTQEPVAGSPGVHQQLYADAAQQAQAQGGLSQMGSVTVLCPHCGGLNGEHRWAGTGTCPGVKQSMGRTDNEKPDAQGNYPQGLWPPRPQGMGWIPLDDGYEVAKIYKEARERLLEELKIQVEVNRRLSLELAGLRLELASALNALNALNATQARSS